MSKEESQQLQDHLSAATSSLTAANNQIDKLTNEITLKVKYLHNLFI